MCIDAARARAARKETARRQAEARRAKAKAAFAAMAQESVAVSEGFAADSARARENWRVSGWMRHFSVLFCGTSLGAWHNQSVRVTAGFITVGC